MTRNTRMRRPAYSWRYLLPATGAPLGGGLMKIGHASTWAATSVALAPFAILITIYTFFAIGYVPAMICFLSSGRDQQDAQTRQDAIASLITTSANALIALLTFTPMNWGITQSSRTDKPELRILKGGSDEASKKDES